MKMKKIKVISEILSAVFSLLALTVFLTESDSVYNILIGTVNGDTLIAVFAVCSAVCLLISAITAILSKTEKRIVLNSVIRFLCICIIGFFALISAISAEGYRKYYKFTSPDGAHTVIAEEWSYLLGGGVVFYERINPMLVEYKESFDTDDGFRAISSGDYLAEWEGKVMCITMQDGNRNYKTLKIKTET